MTTATGEGLSVPTDTLEVLIQEASVPDLASLFRKAKKNGAINPVSAYGEGFKPGQKYTTQAPA